MTFKDSSSTSRHLIIFRVVIALLGLIVCLLSFTKQVFWQGSLEAPDHGLYLLVVLMIVGEFYPLNFTRYGTHTIGSVALLAGAFLYGLTATVILILLGQTARFVRQYLKRPVKIAFLLYSTSQVMFSYFVVGGLIFRDPHEWDQAWKLFLVALCFEVGVFLIQSQIVAVYHWIEQHEIGYWGSRIKWEGLWLVALFTTPLGVLLIYMIKLSPVAVLLYFVVLSTTLIYLHRYVAASREFEEVIESLVDAVEKREPHSKGHASRVARYAVDIARQLGASEKEVVEIQRAAWLHDLGKISVDESILMKSEDLTEEEVHQVKQHPSVGAEVVSKDLSEKGISKLIRHHHEHFDGGGYPDGLKEEEIPFGSRILAVAEAFDTMVISSPYAEAKTVSEAMEILKKQSGSQFDPKVVKAFTEVLKQRKES